MLVWGVRSDARLDWVTGSHEGMVVVRAAFVAWR